MEQPPPGAQKEESQALTSAAQLGLNEDRPLPRDASEMRAIRYGEFDKSTRSRAPHEVIGFITMKLAQGKTTWAEGWVQATFDIIRALNSLVGGMTPEDEKLVQARFIVTSVLGENHRARNPYAFPEELQNDALIVQQRLEDQLPIVEETVETEDHAVGTVTPNPRPSKRRRTSTQAPVIPITDARIASVLRGLIMTGGTRKSYRLDKTVVRDSNVAGHNGLTIGQWWPYRLCAIRDGAHGAMMAGIAGSEKDGAYSIVVSGQYVDLDKDYGDTIYYSGSKSHDNEDPVNPIRTHSTKALETSRREGRSVRVLRGAGGANAYAPSVGLRYDGLYRIVSQGVEKNFKGGAYIRFTLSRRLDQVAMDTTRPNTDERACFERLKEL